MRVCGVSHATVLVRCAARRKHHFHAHRILHDFAHQPVPQRSGRAHFWLKRRVSAFAGIGCPLICPFVVQFGTVLCLRARHSIRGEENNGINCVRLQASIFATDPKKTIRKLPFVAICGCLLEVTDDGESGSSHRGGSGDSHSDPVEHNSQIKKQTYIRRS